MLEENSTTNVFTNRSSLKIIGNENTTIECKQNAGLAFKNVINITIHNITFYKCGMIFDSTSENPNSENKTLTSKAALLFEFCNSVNLTYIIVENSDGVGIQMYNTIEKVYISHSIFSGNKIKESHSSISGGGGGLYIELKFSTNAKYEVRFSKFVRNIGSTTEPERTGNIYYAFGRGGGLAIQFRGNARYNVIRITNCTFKENNAQFGAGMFVAFKDTCYNNTLNVEDSQLISNKAIAKRLDYTDTVGGGVKVDYAILNTNKDHLLHNKAIFNNVTFVANAAFIGGGFSVRTSKEKNVSRPTNLLHFIGCHWLGNRGRLGAAIDLNVIRLHENGQQLKPHFTNCTFISNTVTGFTINDRKNTYVITDPNNTDTSGGYWPGSGTMYLNAVTVDFLGNVTFTNNTGGAIVAIDAAINIKSKTTVSFSNNRAELGGALYLSGNSWIRVSPHVQVAFINNSAYISGGAIYYQKSSEHDLPSSVNCFIRYSDVTVGPDHWHNVTFLFSDNCASTDYGGDAIYATTVVDCAWNGSFKAVNEIALNKTFIDWPNFKFSNSSNNSCSNFIQTSARYISFEGIKELKVAPGKIFKFPFKVLSK